jgi:hypothetical protein
MVERRSVKPQVAGSIPVGAFIFFGVWRNGRRDRLRNGLLWVQVPLLPLFMKCRNSNFFL